MGIFKSFTMALSNLVSNKMRSFLTMLGIIIGVAAVIMLISFMNGMMNEMNSKFDEFGTNTITVSIRARGGSRSVDVDEMYDLANKHSDLIVGVTPKVNMSGTVKCKDQSLDTMVTGVNEQQADMGTTEIDKGRFIRYVDIINSKRVCVLGTYVAKELFGEGEAVGQSIKINGYPFEVIGVLAEKADSEAGGGDEVVYISYKEAMKMAKMSTVSSYTVAAVDDERASEVTTILKDFLFKKLGDSDYYTVTAMREILDVIDTLMGTMEALLICIAGISLAVGGIGIMNIMLVSVSERTREIGIRKSMGAKRKYIMQQFVIEAGTVSGIGGVIGIIVGCICSVLGGKLLNLTCYPSIGAIMLSFSISVGIGIIFGFLPANKAAKLNPIDALRYD